LLGSECPGLSLRDLRPLVDSSLGYLAPGLFLFLFHPPHLGFDVRLFIERAPAMCFHFDQYGCCFRFYPFLEFDDYGPEDICVFRLRKTEFRSPSYPFVNGLTSGLAVR